MQKKIGGPQTPLPSAPTTPRSSRLWHSSSTWHPPPPEHNPSYGLGTDRRTDTVITVADVYCSLHTVNLVGTWWNSPGQYPPDRTPQKHLVSGVTVRVKVRVRWCCTGGSCPEGKCLGGLSVFSEIWWGRLSLLFFSLTLIFSFLFLLPSLPHSPITLPRFPFPLLPLPWSSSSKVF